MIAPSGRRRRTRARRSRGCRPASAARATGRSSPRPPKSPTERPAGWSSSPTCSAPAGRTSRAPSCRRRCRSCVKDAGAPPANLAVTAVRVETRSRRRLDPQQRARRRGAGRFVSSATAVRLPPRPIRRPPTRSSTCRSRTGRRGQDRSRCRSTIRLDLRADNTRYAVLDPAPRQSALVVTSGTGESGFYLSRALLGRVGRRRG